MTRQRQILTGLLVFLAVEAALIVDPVRPWLPFSLWTLDAQAVSATGLLAFLAVALLGAMVPLTFPGLRPLPLTFPLIGACLLLYGLPPASGLAVLTVLLASWREERQAERPAPAFAWAPVAAGMGLGLLMANTSGYFLPDQSAERAAPGAQATLVIAALIATGTILAALVSRYLGERGHPSDPGTRGLGYTLLGGVVAAAVSVTAAQAVRLWGLGPLVLVLGAPFAAMAPAAIFHARQRRNAEASESRVLGLTEVLEAIALAIEAKDRVSAHHLRRMRALAGCLGRRLGMSAEELQQLDLATLLHDIGKLAVPEWILSKPGALTVEEWQKMTLHSETAGRILGAVPFAREIAPVVKHHHEHFDGTGYPDGLSGLDIPLGARILAVVDALDSIMSERAYHHAVGPAEALAFIRMKSGSLFDPRVVRILLGDYNAIAAEVEAQGTSLSTLTAEEAEARAGKVLPRTQEAEIQGVLDTIATAHMEIYSLHEIGQALGKALNVEESLSLIAGRLGSLFHFTACAVYVFDAEKDALIPRLTAGRGAEALQKLEIPLGAGLSGWAARERRPIIGTPPAEPILREAARSDFDGLEDRSVVADLASCVAAPLIAGNELIGVVTLYDGPDSPYSVAEERLLTLVGRQVGSAIRTGLLFERTQEHTLTDFLTGLPNARYMFVAVEREAARARDTGDPFSILILNLDGFGRLNEQYGHPAGDRYLIGVSKVIRSQMRDPDTCVRYSGDEFVAILPGVGREEAKQVAERIERAVESFAVEAMPRKRVSLTISTGHATHSLDGLDLEEMMRAAQDRLTKAKIDRRAREASGSTLLPFRHPKASREN